MRGLGLYLAILAGAALVFFGVMYWPNPVEKGSSVSKEEIEARELKLAESYLKRGKPLEAIDVISRYQPAIEEQTPKGKQWLDLLVQASEQSWDVPQLAMIFEHFPEALKEHEKAALLLSESFVATRREEDYDTLRQQWHGRETQKEAWTLLDADQLLNQNRYQDAVKLLVETPMDSKQESGRLIRLALLHTVENPEKALEYLAQAQQRDPLNRDVFLYQGRLHENKGNASEELTAYKQAIKHHPKDPGLYDQLAEFYMRHQQYAQALDTWQRSLALPGSDSAWLKTLFWGRMISPIKTDWSKVQPPEGKLRHLILFLLDLPQGKFWDEEAFARLPDHDYFLKTQQETFWLRLLAALQDHDDNRALQIIHENPFRDQLWNPNLELALLQTLHYRKVGDFIQDPGLDLQDTRLYPSLYSIYRFNHEPNGELEILLKSREAFMANVLAAGWPEAALQLHTLAVMPDEFPEWAIVDLALAIRKNRGDREAYAFLKGQHRSPKLELMEKELSARIALDAGDQQAAANIYESVADRSAEAKSYLARKAFKEKDWPRARQLTEDLLKIYPDNVLLQDNLKKIQAQSP